MAKLQFSVSLLLLFLSLSLSPGGAERERERGRPCRKRHFCTLQNLHAVREGKREREREREERETEITQSSLVLAWAAARRRRCGGCGCGGSPRRLPQPPFLPPPESAVWCIPTASWVHPRCIPAAARSRGAAFRSSIDGAGPGPNGCGPMKEVQFSSLQRRGAYI